MSKENNTKSWPKVIADARQIEAPEKRLNYLVQNQPDLPLHTTAETYKEQKHEKFPNRNNFVSVIKVMRL